MDPWYLLRVNSAGLLGSINLGQEYDHTEACGMCGAGARPVPPILPDLARMGAKQLDATAHDNLLIASRGLAESLESPALPASSNASPGPVPQGIERLVANPGYLDDLAADAREQPLPDLCTVCGRAGHFDDPGGTQLVYAAPPSPATDFGLTWEYLGGRFPAPPAPRLRPGDHPGGHRLTLASGPLGITVDSIARSMRWM